MDRAGDRRLETAEDYRDFFESPGGTPENLAGNLMQELLTLSVGQLDLLKQQNPQYAEALEQAMNQGRSLSEPSIKARTLVALFKSDHPTVSVAKLIEAVRKIKEQS